MRGAQIRGLVLRSEWKGTENSLENSVTNVIQTIQIVVLDEYSC